jgi:hypothetical protein
MRISNIIATGACLLVATGLAGAATFTLYGTGFSNTGTLLSGGSKDGNWTLISDPGGSVSTPATPFVTDGSAILPILDTFPFGSNDWLQDTSASEWISPKAHETTSDPAGDYAYEETFNLTGLELSSVVITGKWSADNSGDILVNGVPVTGAEGTIPANPGEFKSFTSFVLNSSNADFQSGTNTIEFLVLNNMTGSPNVTGVNVDIQSTFADPVPEPASFTLMGLGLSALCLGARKWKRR